MKLRILIALALACLLVAGCGDDDDEPASEPETTVATPEPLTPEEAAEAYDAAVADQSAANDAFEQDVNAALEAGDVEGVQEAAAAYSDARTEFGDAIQAIGFPPEAQSDADAMIIANEAAIGALSVVAEVGSVEEARAALDVAVGQVAESAEASETLAQTLVDLQG